MNRKIGERLKKLRQLNGYTQKQVGDYLKIDQSNLSEIENGQRTIDVTLAREFCLLYNCTQEYLIGRSDKYKKPDINLNKSEEVDLNAIAKIHGITGYLKLLRRLNKENKADDCLIQAERFRNFSISNYSPINIFSLALESFDNLTIILSPMNDNIYGCCAKTDNDYVVLINSNQAKGRQNFTLAHELYHLLYESSKGIIFCSLTNSNEESEKKANDFASNLLLPNYALYKYQERNNIEKWSMKNIIKCEQYFQISHSAFLTRLKEENLITQEEFENYKSNVKDYAQNLGFDLSLYKPTPKNKQYYTLGNLIPLVEKAFDNNKITKGLRDEIFTYAFRADMIYNLNDEGNIIS